MFKTFKIVAILEGMSYLALLSNMLFVKPNDLLLYKTLLYPIGMSHGILFVAYIFLAILNKFKQDWNYTELGLILFASLIPFGTFYIDRKYLKNA